MKRLIFAAAVGLAGLGFANSSQAGIYTDDLSRCLVRSANAADQSDLIAWIYAAISAHPDLARYSKITPEEQAALSAKGGALMVRLLTVDCRKESVAALKYEGPSAFETSFGVLGEIAMRGMMGNPSVGAALEQLTKSMDRSKLEELGREAGTSIPPG